MVQLFFVLCSLCIVCLVLVCAEVLGRIVFALFPCLEKFLMRLLKDED